MLFSEVDQVFVLTRATGDASTRVGDDDLDAARFSVAQQATVIGALLLGAGTGADVVVLVDVDDVYAEPISKAAVVFLLAGNAKLTTFFVVADAEVDSGR